jgi:uncharacterized protein YpmB
MSKKFPDLNKDGKITKADVLIGRGVIQANDGKKIDLMSKKFDKILDTGIKTDILRNQDDLKKGIDTFAESKTQKKRYGKDKGKKPRFSEIRLTAGKEDLKKIKTKDLQKLVSSPKDADTIKKIKATANFDFGKLGEPVKIPKEENTKILKTVKDTVRSKLGVLTPQGRLMTSLPSLGSKALGLVGYFVPSQMGHSELQQIERKKYGGPVGVKMAKGGFKKKTPIY